MNVYLAFGLGFFIAANLLLSVGLAAYHVTVTKRQSREEQGSEQWHRAWSPKFEQRVGEQQFHVLGE